MTTVDQLVEQICLPEPYHLDLEVRSKANLKKVGAYKYAEHPSTKILLAAVSKGDGPTYIYCPPQFDPMGLISQPEALDLMIEMSENSTALVYAHNSMFERAVTAKRMLLDIGCPAPEARRFRCTMAMARRAALPEGLGEVGAALGLATQKDPKGKRLISKFCVPRAKDGEFNEPADYWDDFVSFAAYCVTDVEAEKGVHHKLIKFDLKDQPLQTYLLDTVLNDRGVPVNVPALLNAQKIMDEVYDDLGVQFVNLTGLTQTQGQKIKAYLNGLGVPLFDMTGESLEAALEQQRYALGEATLESNDFLVEIISHNVKVLELYLLLNYAAAKKVTAMLNCVCDDGFVRGTLHYHGAGTGRWTAKLIQPQNFKKPTKGMDTTLAYQMICDGCSRQDLEIMFGNALEVIASCIRHFIHWPDGPMNDADYAAVEARIVAWLCGQEDALEAYRKGVDRYRWMAGIIYARPMEAIKNPSYEREVGKHTILGCGFGMWVPKFIATCEKFGVIVSETLAYRAVTTWREEHDMIVAGWDYVEAAAKNAINHPGKVFKACKLKFMVVNEQGIPFLVMQLPSGRNIVYPHPKLEMDQDRGQMGITFWGQLEGKAMWTRIRTWGAKLLENATQGVAADIMAIGACNAEANGYPIFMLVHDQAFGPHYESHTLEEFCKHLTTLPSWADGLPIKAEGKLVPYYTKT